MKLILLDTDVIIEVLDKKSDTGNTLMLRIIESGEKILYKFGKHA